MNEFQDLRRIDRRDRVRADNDGRHAARDGGSASGTKALLVPLSRFANLDPDIDDPGCQAVAPAVDDAAMGMGFPGTERPVGRAILVIQDL